MIDMGREGGMEEYGGGFWLVVLRVRQAIPGAKCVLDKYALRG